ncbi:MAG: hypothetical protein ACJAWL_003372 [Motiliproteus sp.]|jgi:hypothetical protein
MASKDIRISAGHPCEPVRELWLEVTASGLAEPCTLVLESQGAVVTEFVLDRELADHSLYKCDFPYDDPQRRDLTLSLQIETEQGPPLRLPWLDAPKATLRAEDVQDQVLLPIYPMANMPVANFPDAYLQRPALLRQGYLYVFWHGLLWRELEVDPQGHFRDINVMACRGQAQQSADPNVEAQDLRPAVGKALQTLWLPARVNANQPRWCLDEFQLAWSEVQWSWAYIRSLESWNRKSSLPAYYRELREPANHDNHQAAQRRQERCLQLEKRTAYSRAQSIRRFGPQEPTPDHLWPPIHQMPPCRPRDLTLETLADAPAAVTSNLSGSPLTQESAPSLFNLKRLLEQAREQLEADIKKNSQKNSQRKSTTWLFEGLAGFTDDQDDQDARPPLLAELTSQQRALQALGVKLKELDARIEGAEPVKDALQPLRDKAVAVVLLPDPLFRAAWLTLQYSLLQQQLEAQVETVRNHPHFDSALLVQQRLFGRHAPTGSASFDQRKRLDRDRLNRVLGQPARVALHRQLSHLNGQRERMLGSASMAACLEDYFSLNGAHYLQGFALLSQLLTGLAESAQTLDPLLDATDNQIADLWRGSNLLERLLRPSHRLGRMLVPDPRALPLDSAVPDLPLEINDGSGTFRSGLLQTLSRMPDWPQSFPEALTPQRDQADAQLQELRQQRPNDSLLSSWLDNGYTSMGSLVAEICSDLTERFQLRLTKAMATGSVGVISQEMQALVSFSRIADPLMHDIRLMDLDTWHGRGGARSGLIVIGIDHPQAQLGMAKLEGQLLQARGGEPLQRVHPIRVGHPGAGGNLSVLTDKGRAAAVTGGMANHFETQGPQANTRVFVTQETSPVARMLASKERLIKELWLPRLAPVAMLGVFGFYNVKVLQDGLRTGKDFYELFYGLTSLGYWLGELTTASQTLKQTRMGYHLTKELASANGKGIWVNRIFKVLFKSPIATWGKLAGGFAVYLEIGLLLWEALEHAQRQDQDAAASYATAAGGLLLVALSTAIGPQTFAALGVLVTVPVIGWVVIGFTLALGGLAYAVTHTDSELEQWLEYGPFGTDQPNAAKRYLLSEPELAYRQLLALCSPLQLLRRDPRQLLDQQYLPEEERIFLTRFQDRVAVIELRSSALPLFKDPVEALNVRFWKQELATDRYRAIQPLWTYGNPAQGWVRFYFEPCRTHTWGGRGGEYRQAVEVLLAKARLQAEELLIPAGALEQPLRLPVSSLLSPPDVDTPKPDEDSHYWTALEADA